ncbi:hypothetical protein FHT80_005798 [Rhizobium sp. BK226]|uniref:hypothetical protein n=1 Tax=Rhizobium sp. BK226 TaxID=2587075 RepID=UPI00161B1F91|nr:hypothetical protein [Rhizobium sp. BK226]MBB4116424.1 hypothetical protein [Rhizobium sp. BK226]
MDDSYMMEACIDFATDSFAISIPVLFKAGSNYVFIPKTNNHFLVVDFYEIGELGYDLAHMDPSQRRMIRLGEKVPVPIISNGKVFVIDPGWSDEEIRRNFPDLEDIAIKAFLSLRSRAAEAPVEIATQDVAIGIFDLLENPSRSKYWTSKFGALIRAAFENAEPTADVVERINQARKVWLTKFATKATLKQIKTVTNTDPLPLGEKQTTAVLMARLEGILLSKGIYTPLSEVSGAKAIAKNKLWQIYDDEMEIDRAANRRQAISKLVADQLFKLSERHHDGYPRGFELVKWPRPELRRILTFFEVFGDTFHKIDEGCKYLLPLYHASLSLVQRLTVNRYVLIDGLLSQEGKEIPRDVLEAIGFPIDGDYRFHESRVEVVKAIVEQYEKLILISKIARPNTRSMPDSEIGFQGVDHALIDALWNVRRSDDFFAIQDLLVSSAYGYR